MQQRIKRLGVASFFQVAAVSAVVRDIVGASRLALGTELGIANLGHKGVAVSLVGGRVEMPILMSANLFSRTHGKVRENFVGTYYLKARQTMTYLIDDCWLGTQLMLLVSNNIAARIPLKARDSRVIAVSTAVGIKLQQPLADSSGVASSIIVAAATFSRRGKATKGMVILVMIDDRTSKGGWKKSTDKKDGGGGGDLHGYFCRLSVLSFYETSHCH